MQLDNQLPIEAFSIGEVIEVQTPQEQNFANVAEFAALQIQEKGETEGYFEKVDDFSHSPTISAEIHQNLPDILKSGCDVFYADRPKDVFLTGALGILSGCLPNVHGYYRGDKVYPHLYTFTIAPPASGKGVLKNARKLAQKYHHEVVVESKKKKEKYEQDLAAYEKKIKTVNNPLNILKKPDPQPLKVVFIPANTSNSRLLEHLQNNGGEGIICETEADIMSQATKQDWGNYSPLLRTAFHHETYSLSRKSNDEFIEIDEPRIAAVLTGTPSQLPNLINSVEDGLFSRFLFYSFQVAPVWQRISDPKESVNHDRIFDGISMKVYDMAKFLEKHPTEFVLTENQKLQFDETFDKLLVETLPYGENASSIAFRHGLMAFRLCMQFTAIRKFETSNTSLICTCKDEDFNLAMSLIKTYFKHSIAVFSSLADKEHQTHLSTNKVNFLNELPDEFKRLDAITIGRKFKMSDRSIDELLKNEEGKSILKVGYGQYEKKAP